MIAFNTIVRTASKLAVLAAVLLATTFAFGSDANAGPPPPEIFMSASPTAGTPDPAIIVNPGTITNVYVLVKGVDSAGCCSTGVSAFNLALEYDETKYTLYPLSGDVDGIGDKDWLESTGRTGACIPEVGTPVPGEIGGGCSTLEDAPPYGATGSGILGHFRINAENELHQSSQITFIPFESGTSGTFIVDTPLDPDDQVRMPVTLTGTTVVFLGCADNSSPAGPGVGDLVVDLSNDILGVILRFQWNTSNPAWHDAYDINLDGVIDLSNDILGTILQFQNACVNPQSK